MMRQNFTPQELADHFTLLPAEQELLANKTGANRLGFVVLLKSFQWEGRFPAHGQEVPRAVVDHIARTLTIPGERSLQYDLEGRSARYHKEQMRQWTGVRVGTTADADAITTWLCAHPRVDEATPARLTIRALEHYKALHIEPPTPGRLERMTPAAQRTLEEQFFTTLAEALKPETRQIIDTMLTESPSPPESPSPLSLSALKADAGRRSLDTGEGEVAKLSHLQGLMLPYDLLTPLSTRYLQRLKLRVVAETLHELRRHADPVRYGLVAGFCAVRAQEITDDLTDLLLHVVHKMGVNAEKRVEQELLTDFKRVTGKTGLLFHLAEASLAHPKGQVDEVIYPVVGEQTLRDLVKESHASGRSYREKVHMVLRGSYSHHDRRMVPKLLSVLSFQSNHDQPQPVSEALDLVKQYAGRRRRFYANAEEVPLDGVVPKEWQGTVGEADPPGQPRIHRINYEMHILTALRARVRCKEIWLPGAQRYRNPEDDLPTDFPDPRLAYDQALHQPLDAEAFIAALQHQMRQALETLDAGMPTNPGGKILQRPQGWIKVAKLDRLPEPPPWPTSKWRSRRGGP